jgi:hypothetical protein
MAQLPSPPDSTRGVTTVHLAGQALTLAALLLPAVGVGVRWIAFLLDPLDVPALRVAVAAPLPQLVGTGLVALLWYSIPTAIAFLPIMVLFGSGPKLDRIIELYRTWERRAPRWLGFVLLAVVLLALLFIRGWPLVVIGAATTAVVAGRTTVWFHRREKPNFGQVWPLVILVLTGSAVSSAFMGLVPGVNGGWTTLEGGAPRWYYELGRTTYTVFIRTCAEPNPELMAVQSTDVTRIVFPNEKLRISERPRLWDVLLDRPRRPLGLRYACPVDPESPPT